MDDDAARPDPEDKPRGEIGNLEQVLMSDVVDDALFLIIQYDGFRYMGAIGFDDHAFCRAIYTLLNSHIGRAMKEIGDLDLSIRYKSGQLGLYLIVCGCFGWKHRGTDNDFDVMIRLRRELASLFGEEFNVFRSGPERADKDVRVFLGGKP